MDISLREFVGELLGNLVSFDSRVWRTLVPLLFRPGELTARYLAGQRVRFVPPVRLYVFVSILYFLLMAWIGADGEVLRGVDDVTGGPTPEEIVAEADVPEFFRGVLADPAAFRRAFLQGLSYLMFFLVPAFAGLTALAYWRRKRPYLHHLLFAVHIHAFVFLLLSVQVLLEASVVLRSVGELLTLAVPVYLYMGLRRVYGGRRWVAGIRVAALLMSYMLILGLSVAALALLLIYVWSR